MKNTIKIALVIIALFAVTPVFAQKPIKLGHIDANELLKIMPERDSAYNVLKKETEDLELTLKSMQSELEKLYNDLMQNQDKWSDLIKQTKQKELQDKSMRIQEFQENAQKNLQEKERSLFTPIIDKAKAAISDVAKENKYTYIYDSGVGALLYFSEDSDDIMPLVKKKLNLK